MKPNGASEIGGKTALLRVERRSECANGRESAQLAAHSCPFARSPSLDELRGALAAVTRALATAQERVDVLDLVRERAALRVELLDAERNARAGANVGLLEVGVARSA